MMTNNAVIGLFAGLLLAIAATTGGFWGLIVALVLGAIGTVVGLHRDGVIDLGAVVRSRGRG
jgi:uncharacterized membrane protein